jgi:flotillin
MNSILMFVLAGIAALVILFFMIAASGYVKAPPDRAYIISGLKRKKILIGKAGVKIPFLERLDKLDLSLIPIDLKTSSEIPTADYINVRVDSNINIKIGKDENSLALAAVNFLNKTGRDIGLIAREVLEGNIREIIGTMTLEEMVSDRQLFAEKVKENAGPDLAAMGLEIISFNVQNFSDNNDVIVNLGVDNVVRISKRAAISRAESEKEIAIAKALAAKEANDAKVAAQEAIAERDAALETKKAELKKSVDAEQAKAEAAKAIEAENQRKQQEIATANANLARQEKEIELKEREVTIKERALEAEVKKTAEAKKYAEQQAADAALYKTQKSSEAELYERERQAEAKKVEAMHKAEADLALAEAEAKSKKAIADAEAEAQKALAAAIEARGKAEAAAEEAKGKAEAEAIRAKAEAEAEGMMKKAEALKNYGEAARQQMELETLKVYFEQLPAIAKAVGEGYQGVDKIVMLGNDSNQLANNIMSTTTQVSEGLSQSLGIDLKTLLTGFLGGKMASNNMQ